MRKTGTILTAACTAFGVMIAALRIIHSDNYMENGLPEHGFLSTFLTVSAIVSIAVCFVIAYMISSKRMSEKEINRIFQLEHSGIYLILQIAAALMIVFHGFTSYPTSPEIFKNHNVIALPLAVIFALVHIFNSVCIYKGKTAKYAGYLGILPPLYFCLQLAEIFFSNMANPILLEYSFECISLGVCALFMLSTAGCFLGKDQVFNITFTGLLTLICAPASLAGPQLKPNQLLLYFPLIIIVLPNLFIFMKNLISRPKKKEGKEETAQNSDAESAQ